MIDDATIYLLRHSVIEASISGLHMVNGYASPSGDDRRQGAVRIAEYQDLIGTMFGDHIIDPCEYLTQLLTKCRRANP